MLQCKMLMYLGIKCAVLTTGINIAKYGTVLTKGIYRRRTNTTPKYRKRGTTMGSIGSKYLVTYYNGKLIQMQVLPSEISNE